MASTDMALEPSGASSDLSSLCQLRFAARDLNLASRSPARSQLSGGLRTRFRGRGMEFEEVRLYQPGDDVRTIDWRVTARTQVTHTKIFREERERPTFMVLDQRSQCFSAVSAVSNRYWGRTSAAFWPGPPWNRAIGSADSFLAIPSSGISAPGAVKTPCWNCYATRTSSTIG